MHSLTEKNPALFTTSPVNKQFSRVVGHDVSKHARGSLPVNRW